MESGSHDKLPLLSSIRKRLEALSCPYIDDCSEHWLAELLFHPNEGRVKLLVWIVIKFDSKFEEILNDSVPVINSRIDSRHQKLLLALNIIGVTKIDDLELISGTASQKKQINFWYELVDILYMSVIGTYSDLSCSQNSGCDASYYLRPIDRIDLKESFTDSCKFVDTLVRENKVRDIFSTEINLLSPDIERIICNETKSPEIPSLKMLRETSEKMSSELNDLLKQYDESAEDRYHDISEDILDESTVDNYCRMIYLKMKTFSQILDSFIHHHDNDMATYCNTPIPKLSDIGPAVNSVSNHFHLQDLLNLIDSLKFLSRSSSDLCIHIKKESKSDKRVSNEVISTNIHREACNILQSAISLRRLVTNK